MIGFGYILFRTCVVHVYGFLYTPWVSVSVKSYKIT
jgi:hypothetical protein